jgi:hypothetical protein
MNAKNIAAVIGVPESMAVNYAGGWEGYNGGVRHISSAFRFVATEIDLEAITPGVITAFLQQLTPAARLSTVSREKVGCRDNST